MADEKNKKDQPSVESLQTQIRQLEKLVNYYQQKATQLEINGILAEEANQENKVN
jgi:ribosomal protein S15P/S13E